MTYVFLGPSLPLDEAKTILDAHYLPPAKQGDIIKLVIEKKPKRIALIDGYFYQALAVWHKEILHALRKGTAVFGASSMGALRAAEVERYGMVGVGEIFKLYQQGLPDDDEVAIVHAPAKNGYLNLSLALVNVRFTLKHAEAHGLISKELSRKVLLKAKALRYPERTLESICKGFPKSVQHIFQDHYVDQKKEDAKSLLRKLSREDVSPPQINEPIFDSPYEKIIINQERSVTIDQTQVSLASISYYTALHHPNFSRVRAHALNRALVPFAKKILELNIDKEEAAEAKKTFHNHIGDFETWLKDNHLYDQDFDQLMVEQAVLEIFSRLHCSEDRIQQAIQDEQQLDKLQKEKKQHNGYCRRTHALSRLLALHLVDILGIECDEEEIATALQRSCRKTQNQNEWDKDDNFMRLMKEEAKLEKLYLAPTHGNNTSTFYKSLLNELRLRKEYLSWVKRAAASVQLVPHYLEATHEDIRDPSLFALHLKETDWDIDREVESWYQASGFANRNHLICAIHHAKLARNALMNHFKKLVEA